MSGVADGNGWNRSALVRIASSVVDAREDAEDIVQEALLRYVGHDGAAIEQPRAWLARVTRNLAIDRARRTRLERARLRTLLDPDADAGTSTPHDELVRRERCREALRALLERSGPRDAATVLLREVFGVDYADLARMSGRNGPACRQALRRALERARERARPDGPVRRERSAESSCVADAVIDRFERAVLTGDPETLLDTLRVDAFVASTAAMTARIGARLPASTATRRDGAFLRFDIDERGARCSLVLGDVVLCHPGAPTGREVRSRRGRIETAAG